MDTYVVSIHKKSRGRFLAEQVSVSGVDTKKQNYLQCQAKLVRVPRTETCTSKPFQSLVHNHQTQRGRFGLRKTAETTATARATGMYSHTKKRAPETDEQWQHTKKSQTKSHNNPKERASNSSASFSQHFNSSKRNFLSSSFSNGACAFSGSTNSCDLSFVTPLLCDAAPVASIRCRCTCPCPCPSFVATGRFTTG